MTRHFLIGYLSHFGFLAWVLLFGGIALALWKLKRWPTRALAIAVILGVFAAYPGRWAWEVQKRVEHNETGHAMFLERCKTQAGYKINRVVEDVDGILLPKVRHKMNEYDPMAPGAAFALEAWDDGYISNILAYRYPSTQSDNSYMASTTKNPGAIPGFSYVDVIDEKDGQRYRVTGSEKAIGKSNVNAPMVKKALEEDPNTDLNIYRWVLDRTLTTEPPPRYAVTFEDHVIPEERQYGIASSTVKVIDTQTHEVLAEMQRYAYYPGKLGSFAGANWLRADKCPGVLFGSGQATRQFVDHVLVARGATLPPPLK